MSSPCVIKNGSGYQMWYRGGADNDGVTGYAESSDGINWTKPLTSPVLPTRSGKFDSYLAGSTSVVYESGQYKMWYTGRDQSTMDYSIGYATSTDGKVWSRLDSPILTKTANTFFSEKVAGPSVVRDGNDYVMYFNGATEYLGNWSIGHIRSVDGTSFDPISALVDLAPAGGSVWDADAVVSPSPVFANGKNFLYYEGVHPIATNANGFGVAEGVPEPGTFVLLALAALVGAVVWRRRV